MADLGYALVKSKGAWGGHIIVRITKRMKRYTTVETMQENPASRMGWQQVTRGLWDFATVEDAQKALDGLREAEREFLEQRKAKDLAK